MATSRGSQIVVVTLVSLSLSVGASAAAELTQPRDTVWIAEGIDK